MRVEVISIGEELLKGAIVNTNVAYLSQQLLELGWKVTRQTTLPDSPEIIREGLAEALQRASLVLMTGGLGPTLDDVTRSALADLFESPLVLNDEVLAHLKQRYGARAISIENQATLPEAALPLLNPTGTAPGLWMERNQRVAIALPGVPYEMRALFEERVKPRLLSHFSQQQRLHMEKVHLFGVSESVLDPVIRTIESHHPEIEFGIYPSSGVLTATFSGRHQERVRLVKQELLAAFPDRHYSSPSGTLEEAIHLWMVDNKKTLALAESCTGGRLASRFTAFPGSSRYFLGSLVTYSNGLKEKLLQVPAETLTCYGAVSAETAKAMVQGVLKTTPADYAVAVTGIAGPDGGSLDKPVGTLFVAVAKRGSTPVVTHFSFPGNREKTLLLFTNYSLGALYRSLVHEPL